MPITPTAMEAGAAQGHAAAGSAAHVIPAPTTKKPPGSEPPPVNTTEPTATLDNIDGVLGDIQRLKDKEKIAGLSKEDQMRLHHSESMLALTQKTNLEAEQAALRKQNPPQELPPDRAQALADANAKLARPWPGDSQTSTHSSGGDGEAVGDSATTNGTERPSGNTTITQTGTGDGDGHTVTTNFGRTTSTSSSGGNNGDTTSGPTHTTDSNAQPALAFGKLIPESTTSKEQIGLARKRAENLEKTAAKRKLDPHEQLVYDNARRIRDRNTPAQTGRRNTGNPKDLVLANDGPTTQTHSEAAEMPAVDAPSQPANAVGTVIEGPGAINPDAPRASADDGTGNSAGTPAVPPQHTVGAAPQGSPHPIGGGKTNVGHERNQPVTALQSSNAPDLKPPHSHEQLISIAKEKCVSLAKETMAKFGKKAPGATSVAINPLTGKTYESTSLNNLPALQPTKMDPRLKDIHDEIVKLTGSLNGHEPWFITNCAEFNAVNRALLDKVDPKNIIVYTVNTRDQSSKIACKNCRKWLEKLGITVITE